MSTAVDGRKGVVRSAWWGLGLLLAFAAWSMQADAQAESLPLSLDVKGKISKTNDAAHQSYHFTEAQLLALPVHSITTATTWTPRSTFTGPLLADILKKSVHPAAQSRSIRSTTIPTPFRCRTAIATAWSLRTA